MPMSARRSAGASLTPSPVIATTWPCSKNNQVRGCSSSRDVPFKNRQALLENATAPRHSTTLAAHLPLAEGGLAYKVRRELTK